MIAELLKYNCSTLFIIKPVMGEKWFNLQAEHKLINSYLKDKSREDLTGELLFVLFKPIDFDYFEMFLEQQTDKNKYFLEDYDYANGYVVLVYRIPEELKDDFELFKQGKYSKLSNVLKSCYEKEIKAFLKPIPTFQWDVFNKSPIFRKELEEFLDTQFTHDMELWELPDETKETLDITNFLKLEQKLLEKSKT